MKSKDQYIGDLAVKASKAVNYQNAGTVEFLLDSENNFYFYGDEYTLTSRAYNYRKYYWR